MYAIANESYSDSFVSNRMGLTKSDRFRPQRELPRIAHCNVIKVVFLLFLFCSFFVCAVKEVFSSIAVRRLKLTSNNIFIISSARSNCIREKHKIDNVTLVDMRTANFKRYITTGLFAKISLVTFFVSIKVVFKLGVRKVYYLHDLYKMVGFIYFLKGMSHGGVVIHFTNHYDRWAVLLDYFSLNTLWQYQHGVVEKNYQPPYKLRKIEKVFCINKESISIWKKNIVLPGPTSYIVSKYTIDLQQYSGDKSVLLISNPLFKLKEVELIQALACKGYNVFYKTHPLYNYNIAALSKERKNLYVVDKQIFPHCEKTVCNGSTLGLEYEASGLPVIWWDTTMSVVAIVSKIIGD